MAQIFLGTKIFAEIDPGRRSAGTPIMGVLAPPGPGADASCNFGTASLLSGGPRHLLSARQEGRRWAGLKAVASGLRLALRFAAFCHPVTRKL